MIVHVAGPRGVGSSTTAFALYMLQVADGRRTGYVDLSQLRFASPPPTPDALRSNLSALWDGYREAGATGLVVAGRPDAVLDGATLCWLTAGHARLRERLDRRRRGLGPPIPGDDLRGRPAAEVAALADVPVAVPPDAHVVVDTDDRTAEDCARILLETATGSPPRRR